MSLAMNVLEYYDNCDSLATAELYAVQLQLFSERRQMNDAIDVVNKKLEIVNAEIKARMDETSHGRRLGGSY